MGNIFGESLRDLTAATSLDGTELIRIQTARGEDKSATQAQLKSGAGDNAGTPTFTIGAESTNVRNISIQFKDVFGTNLAKRVSGTLHVFADTTPSAWATGGSTGIAQAGTAGIATALVAKKIFAFVTDATGKLDLTWTDTGTESVALGVQVGGTLQFSAAFANT